MSKRYFHFTIGPVQGFVAQSRRTRDLLASSFLLSYLVGSAIVKVIEKDGKIIVPHIYLEDPEKVQSDEVDAKSLKVKDPLIQAIQKKLEAKNPPWIGSLPNRFVAQIPDGFKPEECEEAVRSAWKKIADVIWQQILLDIATENTKEIWDRQVEHFWEISWIIGDKPDSSLFDRRKNWRSFVPTEEPGDKCTLIHHLQELSGYERVRRADSEKQKDFWAKVRDQLKSHKLPEYELAENERLSAIGLIKRFFPQFAEDTIGWEFPDEAIYFPSTTYLSAYPWIKRAKDEGEKDQAIKIDLETFPEYAKSLDIRTNKQGMRFFGEDFPFGNLEGMAYYKSRLENYLQENKLMEKEEAEKLLYSYDKLTNRIGLPSSYYALLIMDGDRLGAMLQSGKVKSYQLSRALAHFTDSISEVIKQYEGITVYAGGDDVFALVPLDRAIPLAICLREKYMDSFKAELKDEFHEAKDLVSISAAIVYAHSMSPLQSIVQYAHKLLDDVAKERTGRNSIAIGVWKRSGPDWEWACPWEVFYEKQNGEDKISILEQLAEKLDNQLSRSFLYKLQEYADAYEFVEDWEQNKEILRDILIAEYKRVYGNFDSKRENEAEEVVHLLLKVCLTSKRVQNRKEEKPQLIQEGKPFCPDGALLARFIKQKGEESR